MGIEIPTSVRAATVGMVTTSPSTPGPATDDTPTAASTGEKSTGEVRRYRCAACGNLTRFNVLTSRRTMSFHHYSVGGDLTIEDVDVLDESVEEVSCRWCGNGNAIEIIEA